jgi:hypothetical protein
MLLLLIVHDIFLIRVHVGHHRIVITPTSTQKWRFCTISKKSFKRHIWDFSNINIAHLNEECSNLNWENCEIDYNRIDDAYKNWFDYFYSTVKTHIPNRIVVIRHNDKPWMTSAVRSAIRKRNIILKQFYKKKTRLLWKKYKDQRNYTTTLIRETKIKCYD